MLDLPSIDFESLDLTPIALTIVSAGSVLAGVVVAPVVTARADRRKRSSEAAHTRWAAARDAYVDLLTRASDVELAAGAMAVAADRGQPLPEGLLDGYMRIVVMAELLSTPEVWAEMKPYLSAVTNRINSLSPGMNTRVQESFQQVSLDERLFDPEEIGALRERFVEAARAHIRKEPRLK